VGRAKPRVRNICSTKLVRVAGMFCRGERERERERERGGIIARLAEGR
jgi:hypothetical protein